MYSNVKILLVYPNEGEWLCGKKWNRSLTTTCCIATSFLHLLLTNEISTLIDWLPISLCRDAIYLLIITQLDNFMTRLNYVVSCTDTETCILYSSYCHF